MKIPSGKFIRGLSLKSLKASPQRALVAGLAIALTSILFTSLFTILFTLNSTFQKASFLMVGSYNHASFKNLTIEKVDELKNNAPIKEYGTRQMLGMLIKPPFNKAQIEVSYMSENTAKWGFSLPTTGALPKEGTNEAATDTRVLALLGVEPKIGAEFSLPIDLGGKESVQSFVLSGFWQFNNAINASNVLVPQSRVADVLKEENIAPSTKIEDGFAGLWLLDVMFPSARNITGNVDKVLEGAAYQTIDPRKDGYIATGINWAYTNASIEKSLDFAFVLTIISILFIIIITGYLIIYNVFQISVANDIRFYGMLKTIGTTGRQIKKMIRTQALLLSLLGLPIGLLIGYFLGVQLTPFILAQLNIGTGAQSSASLFIFVFSGLFSVATVLISCNKPGKMAARVSPIEALRYNESAADKKDFKKKRKTKNGASVFNMALAGLRRSRKKLVVTMLSLSLAVVLMNSVLTFTSGFDTDKFLRSVASDFVLGDAAYLRVGGIWNRDEILSDDVVAEVKSALKIETGGCVYGKIMPIYGFVSEELFREDKEQYKTAEEVEKLVKNAGRKDGLLADDVQMYGLEDYALSKLTVIDGDVEKLKEPGYIAAVFYTDDYGKPYMDGHTVRIGDKMQLRYVDEVEYVNASTGEEPKDTQQNTDEYMIKAKSFRDIEYEVAAFVVVPGSISYGYRGGGIPFALGSENFIKDSGTAYVMNYFFDVSDDEMESTERYMLNLTREKYTNLDYKSKINYLEEVQGLKNMFVIVGGVLCAIMGLIGILNFANAIYTGILARRKELAMLEAVGMEGRQIKAMLIFEGMFYTLGSGILSLAICLALSPMLRQALVGMFWFYTFKFTIAPVLIVLPVFAVIGILIPLLCRHSLVKSTIIDRLRQGNS